MPGNLQVVLSQSDAGAESIGQAYWQDYGRTEPVWDDGMGGGVINDFYTAATAAFPEADEQEWRYETGEIIFCDDFTPSDEKKQQILEMALAAISDNPGG